MSEDPPHTAHVFMFILSMWMSFFFPPVYCYLYEYMLHILSLNLHHQLPYPYPFSFLFSFSSFVYSWNNFVHIYTLYLDRYVYDRDGDGGKETEVETRITMWNEMIFFFLLTFPAWFSFEIFQYSSSAFTDSYSIWFDEFHKEDVHWDLYPFG